MPKNLSPVVAMLTTTLLMVTGCADSRDERYSQLAQQALREQAAQNERLADQSQQIAEASQRLVAGDAEARKDLLAAQKQFTSELHSERASIDRQREEMEQERRNIAAQRHRDPIIAKTIGGVGLTLACLLPLLLAGYVIYSLNRSSDDSDALSELLIVEMTAEQPLLLPMAPRSVAALEHKHPPRKSSDESDRADGEWIIYPPHSRKGEHVVSHVVEIVTEVKDAAAVRAACQRLKLEQPSHGTARLFSGEAIGLIVRLPNWQYPVVFDVTTGQAKFDNYGGKWGKQQELDHFLQIYAVEATKIQARKKGHSVTEQQLADGSIKLTVQVGGAA